jgi:hypothetical protein
MSLKKTELYRGFSIFTEQVRPGIWGFSVIEVPSSEGANIVRSPNHGRVPGAHPSKEAALLAARTHIDRINKNRQNRASQPAG